MIIASIFGQNLHLYPKCAILKVHDTIPCNSSKSIYLKTDFSDLIFCGNYAFVSSLQNDPPLTLFVISNHEVKINLT